MGIKSFTRLYRESLCYSVDNKHSNISAALHPFGLNFFASIRAKKCVSKLFFLLRGLVGPWPRAKKTVVCDAISAI